MVKLCRNTIFSFDCFDYESLSPCVVALDVVSLVPLVVISLVPLDAVFAVPPLFGVSLNPSSQKTLRSVDHLALPIVRQQQPLSVLRVSERWMILVTL
jgi:hypothetical protein